LKRTGIFFLAVSLLFVYPDRATAYQVSARAAIFSDSTKVKRLYGKNVHDRVLPASTVKVMTALLVLEQLPFEKIVAASKRASRAQPSKIYLKPGEKFTVRDMLYAILLKSANDAAVALAEAVSGSEWKFVQLMNKRAQQLGCRNTLFASASGLPSSDPQYTTPYDMYLVFRQALKHPFFRDVIKMKYRTIRSTDGRKVKLKSHNKLLFMDRGKNIYGKTGWTRKAGACFLGTSPKRTSTLIIAVFGCSRRWDDIRHIVSTYGKIKL
jgi:serine-type D-Ala-D-Ala carboxypeptidase (penicillin-binding protein 5/6)